MKHCLRSDNAEQNANKGSFNYRISGLHVNTHDLIIPVKLMAPRYWILMCKLPHCTLFRCWPRCLVCVEVSRTFMTLTCFGGHNADGTPHPRSKPWLTAVTLYSDKDAPTGGFQPRVVALSWKPGGVKALHHCVLFTFPCFSPHIRLVFVTTRGHLRPLLYIEQHFLLYFLPAECCPRLHWPNIYRPLILSLG